jgi:outer membrane protein OmpA-like peptidoglycan-associated protein
MKQFIKFLFLLFSFPVFSQSLAVADGWFDKYEYEKAAVSYENIADISKLSSEDFQRWCYSYFVSGNYEKSYKFSDSLIKNEDTPPYFHYVHGYSAMALSNYAVAKQSFERYKTLDTDYPVDSLIVSCQQIPTWREESNTLLRLSESNTDKADFFGGMSNKGIVIFHEKGKDSTGIFIESTLENAELLLMRPTLYSEEEPIVYTLPDSLENFNITSLAFDSQSDDVFITLNNPIDKNELFRSPHIYKGILNDTMFVQLTPWEFAGFEDTTSTAHLTINQSGNLLVFSKEGEYTKGSDLYVSKKNDGKWGKPESLHQLNTEQDEMFPIFMGDSILSFSSNGRIGYGGLDIYLANIDTKANISNIRHLKSPVNSFSDDFNFMYFSSIDSAYYSSNRVGGKGDDDVYFIRFRDKQPEPKVDSTDYHKFIEEWKDIIVYFDFDKYSLDYESIKQIESLKNFLLKYDNVQLIVEGHADRRGTDEYNILLGENRAKTVRDILVKIGIDYNKMEIVSKGKREPTKDCSNGCTEAEYRLNRFVAIKLKK